MEMTKSINAAQVVREWVVLDASTKPFGRLMTEVATLLRGKHKPSYTPNVDCGDFVVIINAKQAIFNGTNKGAQKMYHRHTGYFGGVKSDTLAELAVANPEKLFKLAARGMLPKTTLGKAMLKKLKVYAGAEHPHTAQVKA
jgi:large subunit ribosomal protein L13